MQLYCYSFKSDDSSYLGGIKETPDYYAIFLQDKSSPFRDVLNTDKYEQFQSFEQAANRLRDILLSLNVINISFDNPQIGTF